ncbi:MAG: LLM class flavin-dependent oxidoreductase [Balneolales bacterium]|nr:LLM class flavin-dependent oxidoreductase [Balneolales bacterium]
MEIGVYSFATRSLDPSTGKPVNTARAMRNILEAIVLADQVGLHFFGIGEHHTEDMPASAASVILGAAAAKTRNIRLGSSVTVLSTEDPVRVYQQYATLDALSGGRAEIIAGRGSSTESFPLFGYHLRDYDALYAEKLELLLRINDTDGPISWKGKFRPPLDEAIIVPRPDRGKLRVWLGTGGNPGSSVRAGQLGLPVSYGIIGGQPARFAPLADLYRQTATASGADASNIRVSVASPGFVHTDSQKAKDLWWPAWHQVMKDLGKVRGFAPPGRNQYDTDTSNGGALFAGSPEEIADRILTLHEQLGHDRHFFQMDVGHILHSDFLNGIELLGTKVMPAVQKELKLRQ